MKAKIFLFIDWGRGVWAMQYRNIGGEVISEWTAFPAATPALIVCDEMQKVNPASRVFARLG